MGDIPGDEVFRIEAFIRDYCDPSRWDKDHYVRVKISTGNNRRRAESWGVKPFYLTEVRGAGKEMRRVPAGNPHSLAAEIWRMTRGFGGRGKQRCWIEIVAHGDTDCTVASDPIELPSEEDQGNGDWDDVRSPQDLISVGLSFVREARASDSTRIAELRQENADLRHANLEAAKLIRKMATAARDDQGKWFDEKVDLKFKVLEAEHKAQRAVEGDGDEARDMAWNMLAEEARPLLGPAFEEIIRRWREGGGQGGAAPRDEETPRDKNPSYEGASPPKDDDTGALEWWLQGFGHQLEKTPSALSEDQYLRLCTAMAQIELHIAGPQGWTRKGKGKQKTAEAAK